jgi:hypothetical protein
MAVKPLMCEVPKGFVQQGVKPPNDAQKPEGILRIEQGLWSGGGFETLLPVTGAGFCSNVELLPTAS